MPLAPIHKALIAIFFIAITVVFSAPWAHANNGLVPVPALTGHVIDQTGTLNAADISALQAQLVALEQSKGSQVVLLMVPTTAPEDIAAYANRVGNQWKIGRRDVGDGVLVVVAKNDRKMRIEVAKALEGAIPDIAAARIIDGAMKPRFRQNDYAGGLNAAVVQLSARIAGEALPAPDDQPADSRQGDSGFDWTDLAIFVFFGVMVGGPLARSLFGNALGGVLMGGGVGAVAFWVTSSLMVSGGAGLLALLYTWIFSGRSGPVIHGGGGGGSSSGGSWGGSSSSSDSGGFSSGGGGDFGGGGASGDW
ncbi:MAG: TPM domain-containing protein [Acidovorax sp.]|nr:TPM domain-containing protein [Acidovorax sp.]